MKMENNKNLEGKLNKNMNDILKNECLIDDIIYITSLSENTSQKRTYKNVIIGYVKEKYSLSEKELKQAYLLVEFNLENKYIPPYKNGKRNRT